MGCCKVSEHCTLSLSYNAPHHLQMISDVGHIRMLGKCLRKALLCNFELLSLKMHYAYVVRCFLVVWVQSENFTVTLFCRIQISQIIYIDISK
ncbi:hypothetical protein X975_14256, partial [Stegodyphus mimosarum]